MAKSKRSLLKSTAFKIGTGILFLLLLGLVFLPQLSSTSWFTGKAKQVINENIPGTLNFNSLTLSWLDGVQIQEVVYKDQTQGLDLTVDKISTSKGLLALAADYKNAGVISIDNPKAIVTLREPEVDTKVPTKASSAKSAPSKTKKEPSDKDKQSQQGSLLPPIQVQLDISNGSLITISPDSSQKSVLKDLDLNLTLDGKKGVVDYLLFFQDELGEGQVTGKGNVVLPQDKAQGIDAIESDGVLEIRNWQIAELLSIAQSQFKGPGGEGVLNGNFHVVGSGTSAMGVTGTLTGKNIKLHGGPLLSDTPAIDAFNIDIKLQKKAETVEIEKFVIQSPLITATATGVTQNQQVKTLTANATIDIAEIFSQFPKTLNLKEGVSVSEGKVAVKADLSSTDGVIDFAANAHLQHLTGMAEKKKISWKEPLDITVKGKHGPDTITLEKFAVQSAFLQADGSGNSDEIQLKLAADIGAALQELEKFIDINGWASDGKLDLDLGILTKTDTLREVSGNVTVERFELSRNKTVISPAHTLTATITSNVKLDSQMRMKEIGATEVSYTSWLGKGTVASENFIAGSDDTPAVLKNAAAKGSFDLERITTLLHSLGSLPQEDSLSGSLQYDAHVTGENIQKPNLVFSANVSPFLYQKGGKTLKDEKISLELQGTADLSQKSYTINDLKLSSRPIGFTAGGTLSTQKGEQAVSSKGTTRIDFTELAKQLKALAEIELEMSGISEKAFELQATTTGGVWTDILKHATFSTSLHADEIKGYGLTIESFDLPVQLKESLLEIGLDAQVNRGSMSLHPKIDFTGDSPVATLPDNSTILKEVALTGDMSNDLLAKVHPLFKGVSSTVGTIDLEMQHLRWPADKQLQKDVSFSGAFTFNDVKLQAGSLLTPLLAIMKVEDNEIQISDQPMTFIGENERVTCSPLEATVNEYFLILEGSVGFDQTLDYTAKMPVTRKMVSGDVYKYLEGTFITVPITGTVSKPSVSHTFIQKALGDLILQAGKKQLGDQAGKLLQKLFQ